MHRFSIQTMMIAIDGIAVVLALAPRVMQAIHECGECYQVESCEKHLHNIALGLLSVEVATDGDGSPPFFPPPSKALCTTRSTSIWSAVTRPTRRRSPGHTVGILLPVSEQSWLDCRDRGPEPESLAKRAIRPRQLRA
jgi:hypothetical protein